MGARFKGTYLRLKAKTARYRRERQRLRAIIIRRDRHILRLQKRVDQLEDRLTPTALPDHHYPAEMIAMAVFMVIHANASLRCAAKTVGFMATLMGWNYAPPSHGTVDNWKRRLGLYALDYAGKKVGHYVGIFDESIQIGCEKFMVLLGVKQPENYSHFAPLTFDDIEILGLEVRKSWKGDEVAEFTERRLAHHNDIDLQYMVSDQGSNLRNALSSLGITAVADCSHVIMNELKKMLLNHELLKRLTTFMGTYRQVNIMSERSHLCPATLRDKDRFLRIFVIIDWVDRINNWWPSLPKTHRTSLALLREPTIQKFLNQLRQLRKIVSLSTSILKTSGINIQSERAWMQALENYQLESPLCEMAQQLATRITTYFKEHQGLLIDHDRLLCCSDINESLFGRYKNKGGMKAITADVLGVALYGQAIEVDFVRQGLTTVSQKMITHWHYQNTCDNRYSNIRRLNEEAKARTAAA